MEQLDDDELSARLDAALRAKTIGDLDALIGDLNVATMQDLEAVATTGRTVPAVTPRGVLVRPTRPAAKVIAAIAAATLLVGGGFAVRALVVNDASSPPAVQPAERPQGPAEPVIPGQIVPPASFGTLGVSTGTADALYNAVTLAPDGTRIAVGYTADGPAAPGGTSDTARNAVIAAFGPDGVPLWDTIVGGSGDDEFTAVAVTPHGDLIAVGHTSSPDGDFPVSHGPGRTDGVVASFAPDGTLQWAHTYGGGKDDYFQDVVVDAEGNIVVAGSSWSQDGDFPTRSATGADYDAVVAMMSATGELTWGRTYGGRGHDGFASLALTPDGRLAAAGYTAGVDGDFPAPNADGQTRDAVVAGLDDDGNLLWQHVLGGSSQDEFASVAVDADGRVMAVGSASALNGDFGHGTDAVYAAAALFSPAGEPIWVRSWGGPGQSAFWDVTAGDEGFIAVGNTNATSGDFASRHGSSDDGLLARVTPAGDLTGWSTWGGSGGESFRAIVMADARAAIAVGFTSSSTWEGDFPPNTAGSGGLLAQFGLT